MEFRKWLELQEKTLYHGTTIDNFEAIKKYGLKPGVGDFIHSAYSDEYEFSDRQPGVFMTDKEELKRAFIAMVHHVGKKIKKSFHSVTPYDIRNHGLLVIVRNAEYPRHSDDNDTGVLGAEEDDYVSTEPVEPTRYLRGAALMRFIHRMNLDHWLTGGFTWNNQKWDNKIIGSQRARDIARRRDRDRRQPLFRNLEHTFNENVGYRGVSVDDFQRIVKQGLVPNWDVDREDPFDDSPISSDNLKTFFANDEDTAREYGDIILRFAAPQDSQPHSYTRGYFITGTPITPREIEVLLDDPMGEWVPINQAKLDQRQWLVKR